jgi:hypothetical protein
LFGQELEIKYPKNDILRASDGKWQIDNALKVSNDISSRYTGNGTKLQAAVYATGNGNTLNLEQSSSTGAGQQMLINLASSDNNTVNVLQTSASMSSLVLAQNGTGGTTFNVSQTGAYSNVANINATAAGGSFNIIQRSR